MTKSTWTIYTNAAARIAKCQKCGFVTVLQNTRSSRPPTYCPSCAYRHWVEKEKGTDHANGEFYG